MMASGFGLSGSGRGPRAAPSWRRGILAAALGVGLVACSGAPSGDGAVGDEGLAEVEQQVLVGSRRQAEGWASPGTTGVFNEGGGEGQSVAGFQVSETIRYAAVSFGAADRITFSLGAPYGGGRAELWADAVGSGRLLGVLEMGAATGSWNTFATRSVTIPEIGGTHDLYLRAVATGGDWLYKLDWFELHDTNPGPAGVALPARIEAESFVAAHETTAGNSGTAACTSPVNGNVDLGSCSDAQGGCGCSIGWAAPGEWLEYRVTNTGSATANFDVSLRIASGFSGKRVRVELPAGTPRGTVTVDAAGYAYDWQNWVTRTLTSVPVAPGTHTLRLVFEGEVNLNFIDIRSSTPNNPDGVAVSVTNRCPFPLWVHGAGQGAVLQPDDVRLAPGQTQNYVAPVSWPSARVTAYLDGPKTNEIDKVEMTFERAADGSKTLHYNMTYVDWVGLPMAVSSTGGGADCRPASCNQPVSSILTGCPDGLLEGRKCMSARTYCLNPANAGKPYCAALDAKVSECANRYADCRGAAGSRTPEVYACSGPFFSQSPKYCAAINRGMLHDPENTNTSLYYQTGPYNTYSKWAHQKCPGIYALAYDDYPPAAEASGYHACTQASALSITFCPAG